MRTVLILILMALTVQAQFAVNPNSESNGESNALSVSDDQVALHYDRENADAIGQGNPCSFEVAVRFTPEELIDFINAEL